MVLTGPQAIGKAANKSRGKQRMETKLSEEEVLYLFGFSAAFFTGTNTDEF